MGSGCGRLAAFAGGDGQQAGRNTGGFEFAHQRRCVEGAHLLVADHHHLAGARLPGDVGEPPAHPGADHYVVRMLRQRQAHGFHPFSIQTAIASATSSTVR
jgi:hypothetical protein